jgi:hypothetical protein
MPWAISCLGAQYAASLLIRGGAIDELAPFYAASLLVIAEVAYWALEERPGRGGPPALLTRLARLGALGLGAAGAGAAVLVASEGGAGGGLELRIVGIAAAATALALLTAMAWNLSRR